MSEWTHTFLSAAQTHIPRLLDAVAHWVQTTAENSYESWHKLDGSRESGFHPAADAIAQTLADPYPGPIASTLQYVAEQWCSMVGLGRPENLDFKTAPVGVWCEVAFDISLSLLRANPIPEEWIKEA